MPCVDKMRARGHKAWRGPGYQAMGMSPRTHLLQGRSSPFAASRENIQGSITLGGHSWEDLESPTQGMAR